MANPLFPDVFVNGEQIASAEIAAEAQNHNAPKDKPGLAWRAAARALVVRALILQAAAKAGMEPAPEPRGPGREETATEALVRAYLDRTLRPEPVTEAQCRKIYEARPEKAAKLTYDDVVRDIHDGLERAAWTKAARELVAELVAAADITGIDMVPESQTAGASAR